MTRVADTSFLYAFFVLKDAHHDDAVAAMSSAEPIVVPTEILAETIDLLAWRFDHRAALQSLDDLRTLEHVRFGEAANVDAVRNLYAEHAGKLSLEDCYVVQICRVLGAKPLTFDRRLMKAV